MFITDAFAFGTYFSIKKGKIIAKKYLLRMQSVNLLSFNKLLTMFYC